jgi:Flp pilus assembly pilin Flp
VGGVNFLIRQENNLLEEAEMKKLRKGQSTLEYVIILAAVVGAIIAVGILLKPKLTTSYDNLGTKMQDKVNQVTF